MLSNATKRSHYVWQHYLKSWSHTVNKKDYIYCFIKNTGKLINCCTTKVAVKKKIYKLSPFNDLEREYLKKLIDKSLPLEIINILRKKIDLEYELLQLNSKAKELDDRLISVAESFNLQAGENIITNNENMGAKFLAALLNKNLSFCLKKENIIEFYIFVMMQYFRTKLMYDKLSQINKNEQINLNHIFNQSIYIMSYNIANLLESNDYKVVLLLNSTTQEFITGDQPVVNTFISDYNQLYNHVDKMEFYYPISPQTAILITRDNKYINGKSYHINLTDADKLNQLIAKASPTTIFGYTQVAFKEISCFE